MNPLHPTLYTGWPKMIGALEAVGVTQRQIAARAGVTQGFVSKLKNGAAATLKFEEGFALYAFYLERVRDAKIAVLKNGS